MAKQSTTHKLLRSLELLLGMKDPEVVIALLEYGFGPGVIEDGARRIARASSIHTQRSVRPEPEPRRLKRLEDLRARHLPTLRALLRLRYPAVGERLFRNLKWEQRQGGMAAVARFLERLPELEDPRGRFGQDGPRARALLAAFGLTAAVEAEARAELLALNEVMDAITSDTKEAEAAVDAVENWYREWITIARRTVKDEGLRRKLGLLKRTAPVQTGTQSARPAPVQLAAE